MARLHLSACTVDLDRAEIERDGERLPLTPNEARVLRHLAATPGVLVDRRDLERAVFGIAPTVDSRAAGICIRRLRVKLEQDPESPRHLHTVRGRGFRLDLPLGTTLRPIAEPLFGREELLGVVVARSGTDRFLTLTGPGGIGKTRVLRAAIPALTGPPVVFVALGGIELGGDALVRVAEALGVSRGSGDASGVSDQIVAELVARPRTLVLDACEAVRAPLGDALLDWLERAPEARVLASSLRPFEQPIERVIVVPPLDPADARALLDHHAPNPADPWERDGLLDVLSGVPLALVLAAARLRWMAPGTLLERLSGLPDLASVLARTVALLDPPDLDGLCALAVFHGPFTIEAAEAVLGTERAPEVLDHLVGRGIVQREGEGLSVLDPLRQLVRRTPGVPEHARDAHARHVLAVASVRLKDAGPWTWPSRVADLLPDLRSATARAEGPLRAEGLLWLDVAGGTVGAAERVVSLTEALGRGPPPTLRRRLHLRRGQARSLLGELAAAEADITEAVGPEDGLSVEACWALTLVCRRGGRLGEARIHLAAARALAPVAPEHLLPFLDQAEGLMRYSEGRLEASTDALWQALQSAEALGQTATVANVAVNLATVEHARGRLDRAAAAALRSRDLAREHHSAELLTVCSVALGDIHRDRGDLVAAEACYREALAVATALRAGHLIAVSLSNLGICCTLGGRLVEGESLLRRGEGPLSAFGHPIGLGELHLVLGFNLWLQGMDAEAAATFSRIEPGPWAESALAGRACVLAGRGERAEGVALLDAVVGDELVDVVRAILVGRPLPPPGEGRLGALLAGRVGPALQRRISPR